MAKFIDIRVIASILVFISSNHIEASSRRLTLKSNVPRSEITAKQYAAKVSGIDTCDQFRAQASTLPSAASLLSSITAEGNESNLAKDEYETTAQFDARLQSLWVSKLGDPQRLVVRIPIESYKISYNADNQITTVKYMVDDWGTAYSQWIKFAKKDNNRSEYVGTNAFGVKQNVTAIRRTEDVLYFKNKRLTGTNDAYVSPVWEIKLSPDQAREFNGNGSILLMVSLVAPYVRSENHYLEATLGSPLDLSTREHKIYVDLKCAFFTSRDVPLAEMKIEALP